MFSLKLPRSTSDQGSLVLGGIDEELFDGPITRFPAVRSSTPTDMPYWDNAWAIPVTSITFNTPHQPLHWEMPESSAAVLDSGWPCIFLPTQLFRNMTAACGGTKIQVGFDTFYQIPCERRQELATLTVSIGEHNLTITPFDYTLEVDFPWNSPQIGKICLLSFQDAAAYGMSPDLVVLSSPFLRGFYTVFDVGKMEIGCKFTFHIERWIKGGVLRIRLTLIQLRDLNEQFACSKVRLSRRKEVLKSFMAQLTRYISKIRIRAGT